MSVVYFVIEHGIQLKIVYNHEVELLVYLLSYCYEEIVGLNFDA